MNPRRKYASATALRVALEDRLKRMALNEGLDLQRLRRQAAFDRLLCRLFAEPDAPWLLKGGYAMELRLKAARTTRDIDLAMRWLPTASADWEANAAQILELLRASGNLDLHDFFTFIIGGATQDLDAAPYRGARFPVDARLAGRTFAKFHLDVSAGDVPREPFELLEGRDWLGFAAIASAKCPAVSPEEQFAEKLHAYTLPRPGRENTRVKDLVDLALLIERTKLDAARLPKAIRDVFQRRKTHAIPSALPSPPLSWVNAFSEMAAECNIEPNMGKIFDLTADFFLGLKL